MKKILTVLITTTAVASVYAANCPDKFSVCLSGIGAFINDANKYVVAAAGMLFLAVSVIGFFLGVVRFIWAQQQGDQKGIDNGKKLLLWGIIALTCAFSVYGIIRFLQATIFGSSTDMNTITVPRLIIDTPATTGGDGRVPVGPSGAQQTVQVGASPASSVKVPVGSPVISGSVLNTSGLFGNTNNTQVDNGSFSSGANGATFDAGIDNTKIVQDPTACQEGDTRIECR